MAAVLTAAEKIHSKTSLCGHLHIVDICRSPRAIFAGNEPLECGHLSILDCGHFFLVPSAVKTSRKWTVAWFRGIFGTTSKLRNKNSKHKDLKKTRQRAN